MNLPAPLRFMCLPATSSNAFSLRRNLKGTPWRTQIRAVSRRVASASPGTVDTWIFQPCSAGSTCSGTSEVHRPTASRRQPSGGGSVSSRYRDSSSGSRAGVSKYVRSARQYSWVSWMPGTLGSLFSKPAGSTDGGGGRRVRGAVHGEGGVRARGCAGRSRPGLGAGLGLLPAGGLLRRGRGRLRTRRAGEGDHEGGDGQHAA